MGVRRIGNMSGRQDNSPFTKDKNRCFVFLAGLNCISGSCCFPFSSRLVVMRFVQAITYYQSSLMHESFDSISQLGRTAQKGPLLFLVCSSKEWFELTISFTEAHPKPQIWGLSAHGCFIKWMLALRNTLPTTRHQD